MHTKVKAAFIIIVGNRCLFYKSPPAEGLQHIITHIVVKHSLLKWRIHKEGDKRRGRGTKGEASDFSSHIQPASWFRSITVIVLYAQWFFVTLLTINCDKIFVFSNINISYDIENFRSLISIYLKVVNVQVYVIEWNHFRHNLFWRIHRSCLVELWCGKISSWQF